jgi:hypothetical protein
MARWALFIFCIFYLTACNSGRKDRDCLRFRAGEFYLSNKQNGHSYKIVRNDVNQLETDETTGRTSIFTIKWLDPCTYQLTFVSGKTASGDTIWVDPRLRATTTRILNVGKNYYVFETAVTGINFVFGDTIRAIHMR